MGQKCGRHLRPVFRPCVRSHRRSSSSPEVQPVDLRRKLSCYSTPGSAAALARPSSYGRRVDHSRLAFSSVPCSPAFFRILRSESVPVFPRISQPISGRLRPLAQVCPTRFPLCSNDPADARTFGRCRNILKISDEIPNAPAHPTAGAASASASVTRPRRPAARHDPAALVPEVDPCRQSTRREIGARDGPASRSSPESDEGAISPAPADFSFTRGGRTIIRPCPSSTTSGPAETGKASSSGASA